MIFKLCDRLQGTDLDRVIYHTLCCVIHLITSCAESGQRVVWVATRISPNYYFYAPRACDSLTSTGDLMPTSPSKYHDFRNKLIALVSMCTEFVLKAPAINTLVKLAEGC